MHDEKLWEGILQALSKTIEINLVNTWLRPLKIYTNRGDGIVIAVPDRFFKNWVTKNYSAQISSILKESYGIEMPVQYTIEKTVKQSIAAEPKKEEALPIAKPSLLYSEYTFDNFVNGESNSFAYAAAQAVGDGNFSLYNPLYIYGGTGLGKTHLIHAISNRIRQRFPRMNIVYMDAEEFTTIVIDIFTKNKGDQQQNVEKMKERFLEADVFMLDDIQFLKDRDKTLEMFFNIFNGFQSRQKQVIITSDEAPQDINMAERMRSRFASGFQAEINPPTVEERVAILKKNAEKLEKNLTDYAAIFLAENTATSNSRELIAALKRVLLYSSFNNQDITDELMTTALKDANLLKKEKAIVSPQQLITTVADAFNVKVAELAGKKRNRSIATPRQVAMYLLKDKLNLSLKEIGGHLGDRDHSTVKHAIDTVAKKMKSDDFIAERIKSIEKKL